MTPAQPNPLPRKHPGRGGYPGLSEAILDTMRELQSMVGDDYGILPVEVAVAFEDDKPSVRSVRRYMRTLSEQGKIKRLGMYAGYRLIDENEDT